MSGRTRTLSSSGAGTLRPLATAHAIPPTPSERFRLIPRARSRAQRRGPGRPERRDTAKRFEDGLRRGGRDPDRRRRRRRRNSQGRTWGGQTEKSRRQRGFLAEPPGVVAVADGGGGVEPSAGRSNRRATVNFADPGNVGLVDDAGRALAETGQQRAVPNPRRHPRQIAGHRLVAMREEHGHAMRPSIFRMAASGPK